MSDDRLIAELEGYMEEHGLRVAPALVAAREVCEACFPDDQGAQDAATDAVFQRLRRFEREVRNEVLDTVSGALLELKGDGWEPSDDCILRYPAEPEQTP